MAYMLTKWMMRGASAAVLLTFAGCSGPVSPSVTPPPNAYNQAPAPDLMGASPGAPGSDGTGLLGGPRGEASSYSAASTLSDTSGRLVTYRRADGMLVTAMRPIANPEDMSARERRMVYGHRYAPRAHVAASKRARQPVVPASYVAPAPRTVPVVRAAPAARPTAMAVAPKPAAPVMPPAPVIKAAPMVAAAAAAVAPVVDKFSALKAALGAEMAAGSKLAVPDAVTKGQAGEVGLTMPQTLLASLQREAAKLGLTKAASKAEVTATLSGAGYEVTPNGPQTAKLKAGEAPAFNWQVKPAAGERGPLKADVDARLTGVKPPMTFSLASVEQALAAVMPEAPAKKKGFDFSGLMSKLSIKGMKDVTLPVVGPVPSNKLVAGGLILAALLLLLALARGASNSRRRAERRRKFRTMTETPSSHGSADDHHGGMTAPLAAAAVGAGVGAIAAHHHDEGHGDHGHAAHAPAHDDHGHAPAHDDHGHGGHDDHGHAAAHDDHGHGAAAHDDHGHAATDHGHGGHNDHGHAAAHDDHGHGAAAHDDHGHATADHGHGGHDDHGHAAAHNDHGHGTAGHDDHGHAAPDHGHGGHDDHGHAAAHDDHGHNAHHKEPAHAH